MAGHRQFSRGTCVRILPAEQAFAAIAEGRGGDELTGYDKAYQGSWVAHELRLVRNVKPLWTRFGTFLGVGLGAGHRINMPGTVGNQNWTWRMPRTRTK